MIHDGGSEHPSKGQEGEGAGSVSVVMQNLHNDDGSLDKDGDGISPLTKIKM